MRLQHLLPLSNRRKMTMCAEAAVRLRILECGGDASKTKWYQHIIPRLDSARRMQTINNDAKANGMVILFIIVSRLQQGTLQLRSMRFVHSVQPLAVHEYTKSHSESRK